MINTVIVIVVKTLSCDTVWRLKEHQYTQRGSLFLLKTAAPLIWSAMSKRDSLLWRQRTFRLRFLSQPVRSPESWALSHGFPCSRAILLSAPLHPSQLLSAMRRSSHSRRPFLLPPAKRSRKREHSQESAPAASDSVIAAA